MFRKKKIERDMDFFLKGIEHAIHVGENRPRGITVIQAIKRDYNQRVLRREEDSK